tara:strand:+ start:437 stop:1279 length:843 start_codon:yes stop_codon:yes gene_type:complete
MDERTRLNFCLPNEILNKIAKYSLPIYRKPSHGIIMTRQYNIIKLQTIKKIDNIVSNFCINDNIKQNNNNKVIGNVPNYDIKFLDNLQLGELFNNPLQDTKYFRIIATHLTQDKLRSILTNVKQYMLKNNKYKKTSLKNLFLQKKNIYIKKNNVKTISSILKITKKHCDKTSKPRLIVYERENDGTLHLVRNIAFLLNNISYLEQGEESQENKIQYLFKCYATLMNDNFNRFGTKTSSTQRGGLLRTLWPIYNRRKYLNKLHKCQIKKTIGKSNKFVKVR